MSKESIEVVRDHFAATNERDFPRAMSYYAEDVELYVDPGVALESGTSSGRDAVGRFFAGWLTTFAPGYHFDIEEAHDLGDTVLIVAAHGGRGRSSGIEVQTRTAYLYRVRGGKIDRIALYGTRAEALEAAGLSE